MFKPWIVALSFFASPVASASILAAENDELVLFPSPAPVSYDQRSTPFYLDRMWYAFSTLFHNDDLHPSPFGFISVVSHTHDPTFDLSLISRSLLAKVEHVLDCSAVECAITVSRTDLKRVCALFSEWADAVEKAKVFCGTRFPIY